MRKAFGAVTEELQRMEEEEDEGAHAEVLLGCLCCYGDAHTCQLQPQIDFYVH